MEQFTHLIALYGYFAIFPLSIIEGPIITMLGGFFVRLGALNPFLVYMIVIVGDAAGDTLYYAIGHFGGSKFLDWIGRHLGLGMRYKERASEYFNDHGYKTIVAAKLLQGIGPIGLIAAGSSGMTYGRYMRMCISVSIVQSGAFLLMGILLGHTYMQLRGFANIYATYLSTAVLFAIIIYVLRRTRKQ